MAGVLIAVQPQPPTDVRFFKALTDGVAFMRADTLLLRLAIVLGIANVLATATLTVQILFAQDVPGLSAVVMAAALFGVLAAAMLWNVITVSWRQRRIPAELLGRVNGIYRFFGWGSMPLGALAGGIIVSVLEDETGREMALRAPFLLAALCCGLFLAYSVVRLRLD